MQGDSFDGRPKLDFGEAFGVSSGRAEYTKPVSTGFGYGQSSEYEIARPRASYDEDIRLAPYPVGMSTPPRRAV